MSRVPEFSVGNFPFTVVLALSIIVFGFVAYSSLTVEPSPDVQIPLATVTTVYTGASPEDIERDVTDKIEERVKELKNIDYYASSSREGVSIIWAVFLAGQNLDESVRDVREKVSLAIPELPEDANDPVVTEMATSDVPTIVISLASDRPESEIQEIAKMLDQEVRFLPGVSRVESFGMRKRVIRVEVEPDRLNSQGVGLTALAAMIKSDSRDVPAGHLDIGESKYTLRSYNRYHSIEEIENSVIAYRGGGSPVRLKDVASVRDGFEDRETYARLNGKPSINLVVYKKDDANTINTSANVKASLKRLRGDIPADVEIVLTGDQADLSNEQLATMKNSALGGAVLVILILLFFLGVRNSILITLAIPLSLSIAFAWLFIKGYSLNNVTLFGIVVVIGVLVDDAIIVVENVYRWIEQGMERRKAAVLGAHEVGNAILFSGATTIAAFAPLLFMSGVTGQFMKYIPISVIASIIGAMFTAHFIVPGLASRFIVKSKIAGVRGAGFGMSKVKKRYSKVLNYIIRKPLVAPALIILAWFLSLALVVSGALDFEFFPAPRLKIRPAILHEPYRAFPIDPQPPDRHIARQERYMHAVEPFQ